MHTYKSYLLSISLLQLAHRLHALDTIEITRAALVKTLQHQNPAALTEFMLLFKRYEQIVFDFFDSNNHTPLSGHISRMHHELETLERVCHTACFSSITPTLRLYQKHLQELVDILQSYKNGRDIISVGLKVRKFKFLLPKEVYDRGDIALFWALHHRLTCAGPHEA